MRTWADEAGLLLPSDPQDPPKPTVPQAVCDSCPICQAAATLDQVNPQVLVDMTEVARSVITGLGSALASAPTSGPTAAGGRAGRRREGTARPGEASGTTDPDPD